MPIEQPAYRMNGVGLTRLVLSEDHLLAGQPRNGYRERKIPLAMIEGFCIEPINAKHALADFNGDFVLAFRDGEKRRVYRLAVNVDDASFQEVVAALGARRSDVSFAHLPPAEALARMQVSSRLKGSLGLAAVLLGGVGLIVLVMWLMWISR